MTETISHSLEGFRCLRCGQCCRQAGFVYLSQPEADRIAAILAMEPFDFINQYCDLQDRRKLVLRKMDGERCVFDLGTGCRIQEAKPGQCLDFPFKWRTERSYTYCAGLKAIGLGRVDGSGGQGPDPKISGK